jgi:hypothetical protein
MDKIEANMNLMPKTKKRTVTFRVTNDDIVDALKRAAKTDKRSVAVLIEIVMTGWLEQHGYLPKASGERGDV